jgi:hypothetical protein
MIHPTAKASREPIAAAFSSQYDKRGWGTEGSNPSLSTGESTIPLALGDGIDPPALDLIGRPRSLNSGLDSRAGARAPREGKCWRFYAPADPLQAALRLAPLIIPMV